MKNTGITRSVDNLGRIVLPMELRKSLDIKIKDSLEIYVDEDKIILKKFNKFICKNCDTRIDNTDKYCKHCGKVVLSRGAKDEKD